MATNTYVSLSTTTVPSATPSVTLDLTGISGYTDLVLVASVQASASGQGLTMQFNNDNGAGSLYSNTGMRSNGATSISFRQTNNSNCLLSNIAEPPTSGSFGNYVANFMDYANTTKFKTILVKSNSAFATEVFADLWRNTNAITSIKITISGGNIAAGSIFSIYGITAEATTPAPKAIGGSIYSDSLYYYHVFGTTGVFTPSTSLTADVLVVAGGGGGGTSATSGGGGAGGLLTFASQSLTAINYACSVGGGGAASSAPGGITGTNSQFGSLTASAGGGGGGTTNTAGKNGGSGGGGGGGSSAGAGGSPTSGQGFAGGAGYQPGSDQQGGGGGGAGAAGQAGAGAGSGVPQNGGNGGIGLTNSLINAIGAASGVGQLVSGNYYLAGGGGGHFAGSGGSGGGGGGVDTLYLNGAVNTGGGGKGGGSALSGAGGSGVIVVRYLKA
jgi:hypothetical protein